MDLKVSSSYTENEGMAAQGRAKAASGRGQAGSGQKAGGPGNLQETGSPSGAKLQKEQELAPQAKDKAIFAVENNKVVIQIVDAKGKVLQQIPPEQLASLPDEVKALAKDTNLFSREA